jgi:hypothetical protein
MNFAADSVRDVSRFLRGNLHDASPIPFETRIVLRDNRIFRNRFLQFLGATHAPRDYRVRINDTMRIIGTRLGARRGRKIKQQVLCAAG